jgi:transcriptional regulator with XRE-family HTH domain
MAKADLSDLRKAERDDVWRRQIGQAVERVRYKAGLTLEEFADRLSRDSRQVARWITGSEHAQLATIFAVVEFQPLLVIALAEIVNGPQCEVTTTIQIKRGA